MTLDHPALWGIDASLEELRGKIGHLVKCAIQNSKVAWSNFSAKRCRPAHGRLRGRHARQPRTLLRLFFRWQGEWRDYVAGSYLTSRYPGIHALGYIERVRPEQRYDHVEWYPGGEPGLLRAVARRRTLRVLPRHVPRAFRRFQSPDTRLQRVLRSGEPRRDEASGTRGSPAPRGR